MKGDAGDATPDDSITGDEKEYYNDYTDNVDDFNK